MLISAGANATANVARAELDLFDRGTLTRLGDAGASHPA